MEDRELNENLIISQAIPKKIFKDMEATLEEEGLYPKALVHVDVTDE